MFDEIKTATGPSPQAAGDPNMKNGFILVVKGQKLDGWIEQYSELYGIQGTANHD